MNSADFSDEVAVTGETDLSAHDSFLLRIKRMREGDGGMQSKKACFAFLLTNVSNTFVFNELTHTTIICGLDMSNPVLKVAKTGCPAPRAEGYCNRSLRRSQQSFIVLKI